MIRAFGIGLLCAVGWICGAEASTCPAYTYTFSNGSTADATQVNSNFSSILNCANTSLAPLANPSFTGNVGIGTATPGGPLDLINSSQSYIETAGTPNRIVFRTAGGTMASPSATQLGTTLGDVTFSGYGANAWLSTGASIKAIAAENFLNSQRGSILTLSVTPVGTQTLTEAMRVDSTGNVGIGTTTPLSVLDIVTQTSAAPRGLTAQQYGNTSGDSLINLQKARGTLTAPTAVLSGDYIGSTQFLAYDGTSFLASAGMGARENGTVATGSVPQDLYFWTSGGANDTSPYNNNHVRMLIAANGNVGIGTTSPGALLDVDGTLTDTVAGDTQNLAHIGVTLNPPSNTAANFRAFIMSLGYDTASSFSATGSDTPTAGWFENRVINAGSISEMDAAEFWGLWAGSDASSLGTVSEVAAGKFMAIESFSNSLSSTITKALGIKVMNASTNTFSVTGQAGIEIDPITSGTNNTALLIGQTTIPSGNFAIYNASTNASFFAGNVGIGTATPAQALEVNGMVQVDNFGSATALPVCELAGVLSSCSSSLRYKENVKDADFGLSEIEQMRPVTFKWKGRPENDFGLVAEEVAKINPLFVTSKNGKVEGVKYGQLTAVLINAVKELKRTNDLQAAQIAQMQRQIAYLQKDSARRSADRTTTRASRMSAMR